MCLAAAPLSTHPYTREYTCGKTMPSWSIVRGMNVQPNVSRFLQKFRNSATKIYDLNFTAKRYKYQ
jgi:hypothetical protein